MITFKVEGLEGTINKFKNISKEKEKQIQACLNDFADRTAMDAKRYVSNDAVDTGRLLNSISAKYGKKSASVVASVYYAPYVEFGTRKFAAAYVSSLPQEWKSLANKFKGKSDRGGNFTDFVLTIAKWMKRKGIKTGSYSVKSKRRLGNNQQNKENDNKLALQIALKILREGLKARPFLRPAVDKNMPILMNDIKAVLR